MIVIAWYAKWIIWVASSVLESTQGVLKRMRTQSWLNTVCYGKTVSIFA